MALVSHHGLARDESTILASRPGVMTTARGRSDVERALVELAARLETSPALWSVDRASGALILRGHRLADVLEALAFRGPDGESLFILSPVGRLGER